MPSAEDRPLAGRRILMFVGDNYEDLELWYPKLRLIEAGATVTVAGLEADKQYAGKNGYPCVSDAAIVEIQAKDFDGVVIPGGFMPDRLRREARVLELVREFTKGGKLVAAICHGGWIPISAGVYRGVRVTGSLGIKDDLLNAGAKWEDAAVVIDRHFVSSRKPDDLHDFCRGILTVLASAGGVDIAFAKRYAGTPPANDLHQIFCGFSRTAFTDTQGAL
jgi:protease I